MKPMSPRRRSFICAIALAVGLGGDATCVTPGLRSAAFAQSPEAATEPAPPAAKIEIDRPPPLDSELDEPSPSLEILQRLERAGAVCKRFDDDELGFTGQVVRLRDDRGLDDGRLRPDLLLLLTQAGPCLLEMRGLTADDRLLDDLAGLPRAVGFDLSGLRVSGDGLRKLAPCAGLRFLDLSFTPVDDGALAELAPLGRLEFLSLMKTGVRGAELNRLKALPRLQRLQLDACPIGDAALPALRELPALRSLGLSGTEITDAGVNDLAAMTSLRRLDVSRTRLTEAGLARLREALPEAAVVAER